MNKRVIATICLALFAALVLVSSHQMWASAHDMPVNGLETHGISSADISPRGLPNAAQMLVDAEPPPATEFWTTVHPNASGAGIVVCDPVILHADTGTAAFGTACAAWLEMTIGGQAQLGKTPLLTSLERGRQEMRRADLRLNSAQAAELASRLGATHAAVGTVTGTEARAQLRYQLYAMPGRKTLGAPITLTGTCAQILAGLPGMARTLALRLSPAATDIPKAVSATPAEFTTLGQERWRTAGPNTPPQMPAWTALASHVPLAGLLSLSWAARGTNAQFGSAADILLAQAPRNTLVWAQIAYLNTTQFTKQQDRLFALCAEEPNNYALAFAEVIARRALHADNAEFLAARREISDAPRNPDGWLNYAYTVSSAADDVRESRFFGRMSEAEAAYVTRLYPLWEAATVAATRIDPQYGKAWLRVSCAAAFNSDDTLSEAALSKALQYDPDRADVLSWGLQLGQRKWNNRPALIQQMAKLALSGTSFTARETLSLCQGLRDANRTQEAETMTQHFLTRCRAQSAHDPRNGAYHTEMAAVLSALGQDKAALSEYGLAAAQLPSDEKLRCDWGSILFSQGLIAPAGRLFREATRIDPDSAMTHYNYALELKKQHQFDTAEEELSAALRLAPAYSDAWAVLGDIERMQGKTTDAALHYQAAVRFSEYPRLETYSSYVYALYLSGQYKESAEAGMHCLSVFTHGTASVYDIMAMDYENLQDWPKVVACAAAAIAMDDTDMNAHASLAKGYDALGKMSQARAEWQRVARDGEGDGTIKDEADAYLQKHP